MVSLSRLLTLAWLLALTAGCIGQHPLRPPPEVRIQLVDVQALGEEPAGEAVRAILRVQNTNTYPLPAIGLSLRLRLGDSRWIRGVSNQPFGLAAMDETRIAVDLTTSDPVIRPLIQPEAKAEAEPPHYALEGRILLSNDIPPVAFSARGTLGHNSED